MEKWEYFQVNVSSNHWKKSDGEAGSIDISVRNWRDYFSTDLCNDLGKDGWELTGVASENSNTYKLFFKRRME